MLRAALLFFEAERQSIGKAANALSKGIQERFVPREDKIRNKVPDIEFAMRLLVLGRARR